MKVREDYGEQLKQFLENKRFSLIDQFFFRIKEIERYQKRIWEIHDNTDNPKIQIQCINELKPLTVTLTDLYSSFPNIGSNFYIDSIVGSGRKNRPLTESEEERLRAAENSREPKF